MIQRIDLLFLSLASLCMLAGIALGLTMGIRQDFALAPLHGHINLMGWASLALYGLAYRAYPRLGSVRLRWIHLALSGSSAILFPIGLAYELLYGVGGLIVVAAPLWLAGALLFFIAVIGHLLAVTAGHRSAAADQLADR